MDAVEGDVRVLPMFPLGNVLLPLGLLPLHVFEPRYRALTEACLAGDRCFGVVLIERGHEVGGGDVRFATGTLARIVEAGRLDDGRWVLAAVGERRLRIRGWTAEHPYPTAEVELLDAPEAAGGAAAPGAGPAGGGGDLRPARDEVEQLLGRVLAMLAELGAPSTPAGPRLSETPSRAVWEAAALAPLGPLDRQRLLELDATPERLALLRELLADQVELLAHRLAGP